MVSRSSLVGETARGALWTISVAAIRFRRRSRRALRLSRSVPDLLASVVPKEAKTSGLARLTDLVYRKLSVRGVSEICGLVSVGVFSCSSTAAT